MLVKTHQGFSDLEMGKQLARTARILGDHSIALSEGLDGSEGKITEIANRSGNQRQRRQTPMAGLPFSLSFFSLQPSAFSLFGLPSFSNLADEILGHALRSNGVIHVLIGHKVGIHNVGFREKRRHSPRLALLQDGTCHAVNNPIANNEGQLKFRCLEYIVCKDTHWLTIYFLNGSLDDGIGAIRGFDPVSTILLELFHHGISSLNLDSRQKRLIFERAHRDRTDTPHRRWFDFAEMITATTHQQQKRRKEDGRKELRHWVTGVVFWG
jgi:hypothetical protein